MTALLCIYSAVWLGLLLVTLPQHDGTRSIASSFLLAGLLAAWPISVPAILLAEIVARR